MKTSKNPVPSALSASAGLGPPCVRYFEAWAPGVVRHFGAPSASLYARDETSGSLVCFWRQPAGAARSRRSLNLPLSRPAAALSPAARGGEGGERGRNPVQGSETQSLPGILTPSDPLTAFFLKPGTDWLDARQPARASAAARRQLRDLGQAVALPLRDGRNLTGLLTLGPRRDGRAYTPAQRDCLKLLTAQSAILLGHFDRETRWDLLGWVSRGLAHDLQNLLTPLSAYFQLLEQPAPEPRKIATLQTLAHSHLDRLRTELERGRFYAREDRPWFRAGRLDDVVREAVRAAETLAAARQVTLACDALPALTVEMDSALIWRLAMNLLTNAIQASPAGARVRAALQVTGEGGVEVSVTDAGPGLPPERRTQLRLPLALVRTASVGGVPPGLGLAICRAIAALHGGRLEIQSDAGRGTVARFVLPGGPSVASTPKRKQP